MLTLLFGALLMFGGLIFLAAQPMFRARLSSVRRTPAATPEPTLEPSEPAAGFRLKETWPGLAMLAVGAIFLLVG
ncbi:MULTISPECIES: hypothetical protein [unclassified Afipia]|uniref:hypothetical protein n=1 Tax=unclassified Afipia TaxID=2642050 RepID=UPI0004103DC2|nr:MULTISPECIES: hypothetical protein [unclassified Afipia]MAH69225.1 hypothetical protein [Afipia sp.]OUX61760.1 MAG: hypothetical protein CBB64_08285 [Afipia sp. TMED4]MBS4003139.1 hypothetical protein [Afipia sp.]HAP14267.1 hypothetical protein [Afipia sp.]HAQ92363.1 hypothetical protein [Afipia sp.]